MSKPEPIQIAKGNIVTTKHDIRMGSKDGVPVCLPQGTRGLLIQVGSMCHVMYDFFMPNGEQLILGAKPENLSIDHINAAPHLDPLLAGFSITNHNKTQESFSYTVVYNGKPVGEAGRPDMNTPNQFSLHDDEAKEKMINALTETLKILDAQVGGRPYDILELRDMITDYFNENYHQGFMTFAEYVRHIDKLWGM